MATNGSVLLMEEARRLLVRQEADLDTLRSCVATILAGSSVVAAVFAAAFPKHRSHFALVAAGFAIACFAAAVFVCIHILWPLRKWRFSQHLRSETPEHDWIERALSGHAPTAEVVAANFADTFEQYKKANGPQLLHLQEAFAAACVLLGLQVLAWVLAVL